MSPLEMELVVDNSLDITKELDEVEAWRYLKIRMKKWRRLMEACLGPSPTCLLYGHCSPPPYVLMNCLFWNAQRAGSKAFFRAYKYLMNHNKVDVLALMEPRISDSHATNVCKELRFKRFVRVELVGFSGGIWLL
ncbi:LOW QUALITY PROTEIN: hypothetical protein V2J09_017178 [Rumex salicifolius]